MSGGARVARAYDREWPVGRKAAYFASLALAWFWGLAILPYSLIALLMGGMAGEVFIGRAMDFRAYFIMNVLPWIGSSVLFVCAGSLVWGLWLRRRGRYARSAAVQALPPLPGAIVLAASYFAY